MGRPKERKHVRHWLVGHGLTCDPNRLMFKERGTAWRDFCTSRTGEIRGEPGNSRAEKWRINEGGFPETWRHISETSQWVRAIRVEGALDIV